MLQRVIFAGGGTGGHLYPGLAVADGLKSRGVDCLFVGTPRGVEAKVVPQRGYTLRFIRARGLTSRPLQLLEALAELALGTFQSLRLVAGYRPQLVVGTGGYVCAPVLLASAFCGVPTLVMEQNAKPGKATRLLSRLARKVCVSFEESRRYFPPDRTVLTGNPVRKEILTASREVAREKLNIESGRRVLLITGASQGAASINEAVIKALPAWKDQFWTIIHLTGPKHEEAVRSQAEQLIHGGRLDYRTLGYFDEMDLAYAAADLVVGRSGATTIAELTARGLPAILVPYPHAAENHQEKNAQALVEAGAATMIKDNQVGELLADSVAKLLPDETELQAMGLRSRQLGRPHALEDILGQIEGITGPPSHRPPLEGGTTRGGAIPEGRIAERGDQ